MTRKTTGAISWLPCWLVASVVGALVIQAMTTSILSIGVAANAIQAVKGVFVIFVILLYSDQVRGFIRRIASPKGATS